MNFCNKSISELAKKFDSNLKEGLDSRQAQSNLEKYGENALIEKKGTSIFKKFLDQFNDFMIIILLMAAGVSLLVSYIQGEPDYVDVFVILGIVFLNATLGIVQENKAEKALEALKKMSEPHVKVMRDGNIKVLEKNKLVPGDIIILETGDIVSADARLIKTSNLKVLESQLTGEPFPIEKDANVLVDTNILGDQKNMVFAGSSVSYGRGTAIVVATGMNTEVGKIANMIMSDQAPETPLQKKLEKTGKTLGIGALGICFLIFLIGILKKEDILQMFLTSTSLAVAAIPEGLPAIVTIMLGLGVVRMSKKNAVIRKLPVVETLGSATVICSDKTGTLTENKMKVVEIEDAMGSSSNIFSPAKELIVKLSVLCNNTVLSGDEAIGEPTEKALVTNGITYGLNKNKLDRMYQRCTEIPFDSKRKLMTTVHKDENNYLVATKGAPDVLIENCNYFYENGKVLPMTKETIKKLNDINTKMANKALRVLGVAYKEITTLPPKNNETTLETNLIFVGFIGMMDPPRKEVKKAVEQCKKAGIKPVMVTGDHILTAIAIGKNLGILKNNNEAITGKELDQISQSELCEIVDNYTVFARVSPEHKVRIVKAFQANNNVVAMTGDGVNDAPALKVADIGCAMGLTGTDVAKGAADMILTDDNFATIVDAVKEGRGIYKNIRKSIHFLLSSNIGEIITILFAILIGWETPLLAIHLLWINLVTDSLPAIALGLDPTSDAIMEEKPVPNNNKLFSKFLIERICLEGVLIGLLGLISFGIGSICFNSLIIGRTMAFTTLSISQLVHSFNMRSENSIFTINILENIYLVAAFLIGVFLQISVVSIKPLSNIFKVTPLSGGCWLIIVLLCLVPILIVELEKFFNKVFMERNKNAYNNIYKSI